MMMKRLQTVILLCPLLAIEVRGVRGDGDTSDLVKRQTREQGYNDNIALDSSVDAVSKVAPAAIMGEMVQGGVKEKSDEPKFAAVEAVPEKKVDVVDEMAEKVESDPQNTYLQVGKWIAQWDAPYEAWYYYNSESGVSTWSKPKELDGIEFTDPIPDINDAKKKVHSAHLLQEQELEQEVVDLVGDNGVRLERDKPGGGHHHGAHGQAHHDHDHGHQHPVNTGVAQPVSFTSSSPLTQHNSLSIGPAKRPTSGQGVGDPIFHQNFNKPTNKPAQTLSQLNFGQQNAPAGPSQANTGYGSPTQADTGYGSPTQAPNNNYAAPAANSNDEYGAPLADPQSNYNAPAPASYNQPSSKPPIDFTINCLRRDLGFIDWVKCLSPLDTVRNMINNPFSMDTLIIVIGTWIIYNLLLFAYTSTLSANLQKTDWSLFPQLTQPVLFEKRGFEEVLKDLADPDKFKMLIQTLESKYLETSD